MERTKIYDSMSSIDTLVPQFPVLDHTTMVVLPGEVRE